MFAKGHLFNKKANTDTRMVQRSSQMPPKRAQVPSKIEPREAEDQFLTQSLWEVMFERLLGRFYMVFSLSCEARDIKKTLIFVAPASVC